MRWKQLQTHHSKPGLFMYCDNKNPQLTKTLCFSLSDYTETCNHKALGVGHKHYLWLASRPAASTL